MNSTSSIITIGREYGSGGRQIGQEVAKYFGIKCYDKELLEHAANESGICKELFENHDERPTNSFLYSLVMDTYSFGYSSSGFTDMPMNHKVFLAQFDAIKKLASEGPCVMVGRCADYALSEYKDCFSVFVHADTDWRINRLSQKHNKTAKEAKDMINKTDKSRSSYYNYTDKNWIRQIQKQHSKITQNSNNSRIQKFSVYETTKSLVCKTHNAYKHICPFMRQYSIYHHFAFGNKFLFVCKYIQSYNGTDQKILHKDQDIKNTC